MNMKRAIIFLIVVLPFLTQAQNDTQLLPCGIIPNTFLDLNSDGINDLNLTGFAISSDINDPSLAGYCSIGLRAIQNTFLIYQTSAEGTQQLLLLTPDQLENKDVLKQFINNTQLTFETNAYAGFTDWSYGSAVVNTPKKELLEVSTMVKTVTGEKTLWYIVTFIVEPEKGITLKHQELLDI